MKHTLPEILITVIITYVVVTTTLGWLLLRAERLRKERNKIKFPYEE